ncbi:hypothetical protein J2785_007395 [Burkholderia ambifaria]|nr:hypothetical protein [Burkholderia ambifaria]
MVRLKAQWAEEFEQWNKRDLKHSRWVYWWADGIHTGARSEDSDAQCLLVIIASRARNCLLRATFLGMAFKLVESAERSWRRIRGAERIEQLLKGIPFEDGVPVIESAPVQQPLAA